MNIIKEDISSFNQALEKGQINIKILKEYIDSGQDINAVIGIGNYSNSILNCLCLLNKSDLVALTLKQPNLNINYRNTFGFTALHIACINHQLSNVKLLLEHPDININIQNREGQTPLDKVCEYESEKSLKIIKLLLQRPELNINIKDKSGNTTLQYCYYNNVPNITKLLLTHPDIVIDFDFRDFIFYPYKEKTGKILKAHLIHKINDVLEQIKED
jgi:ankyrin repeat protein